MSGSTATASCAHWPSAGRGTASFAPVGSTSHTWPFSSKRSSQDNQVPQGVGPPAQFAVVPDSTRFASRISPSGPKWTALAPPRSSGTNTSLLTTYHQPPSPSSKVADPSGKMCHS